MNMLIAMLTNLIPSAGDVRLKYATYQDEKGKTLNVQVASVETNKLLALIDIHLPK